MSTLLLKDDYRDIRKYSDTVSNRLNSHRDNYAPFKAKSGMSRHSAFLFNEDSASSPKAMDRINMVNPGLPQKPVSHIGLMDTDTHEMITNYGQLYFLSSAPVSLSGFTLKICDFPSSPGSEAKRQKSAINSSPIHHPHNVNS